jgi:hypothetical protein
MYLYLSNCCLESGESKVLLFFAQVSGGVELRKELHLEKLQEGVPRPLLDLTVTPGRTTVDTVQATARRSSVITIRPVDLTEMKRWQRELGAYV